MITGAYHAAVLKLNYSVMTGLMRNGESCPKPKVSLLLCRIPFIGYLLRAATVPAITLRTIFQLMWQCLKQVELSRLSAEYLTNIAEYMRKSGAPKSFADVIEGIKDGQCFCSLTWRQRTCPGVGRNNSCG